MVFGYHALINMEVGLRCFLHATQRVNTFNLEMWAISWHSMYESGSVHMINIIYGFCLLVRYFFFVSFLSCMFCTSFLVHEGFSDGGGVRGIYSLYVLKAIMGKIGLSQKEAPIGTSKRSDVVTVLHFFIFWPTVIRPRAASTAAPVANHASTKRVQLRWAFITCTDTCHQGKAHWNLTQFVKK